MQNLKKNLLVVANMKKKNLANFHASTQKSLNWHFDGLLMSKVYAKFEEEPNCRCKNDMGNLENFHASTGKSQNLHFDGLLMSKVYKE